MQALKRHFYDFPHRRFREILAVQYWDNEETISECLSMIAERHFAEFVLVFFATSLSFQDLFLKTMLSGVDGSKRGEHLASLASACLDNTPASYSSSSQKIISTWIQQIAANQMIRELPVGIVSHFTADQELVARLFLQLGEAIALRDGNRVRFYATLLAQISPQTIQRLFNDLVSVENLDVSKTVCEVILKYRPEFVPALLAELADSEFDLLSRVALTTVPSSERRLWLLILRSLPNKGLALFKKLADKSAPDISSSMRALERREKIGDVIVRFLETYLSDFTVSRKSDSDEAEEVFYDPG